MLPEYRESLHARYPPVCADCLPAVEEELHNKEKMARTNALGSFLKETKGKQRTRRVSAPTVARDKQSVKMLLWRLRGLLWGLNFVAAMGAYTASKSMSLILRYTFSSPISRTRTLRFISIIHMSTFLPSYCRVS